MNDSGRVGIAKLDAACCRKRHFFAWLSCLFAHVRHQRHKTCSLDRGTDRMLAGSSTAGLSPTHDPTLSVNHFLQQFDVLVVHVHRSWPMAIDENGVFFPCSRTNPRPFPGSATSAHWAWRHLVLIFWGEWSSRSGALHTATDSPRSASKKESYPKRVDLHSSNMKYVGQETWSQGEVGPRFALSLAANLCHDS
jgi:hypothetical protein